LRRCHHDGWGIVREGPYTAAAFRFVNGTPPVAARDRGHEMNATFGRVRRLVAVIPAGNAEASG